MGSHSGRAHLRHVVHWRAGLGESITRRYRPRVPVRCASAPFSDARCSTSTWRRPKRKAALQSYILQGLPGIGPKRAKALIERFGSVEAVFKADDSALMDVHGLGGDVVRKIRYAIEEQHRAYQVCRE